MLEEYRAIATGPDAAKHTSHVPHPSQSRQGTNPNPLPFPTPRILNSKVLDYYYFTNKNTQHFFLLLDYTMLNTVYEDSVFLNEKIQNMDVTRNRYIDYLSPLWRRRR